MKTNIKKVFPQLPNEFVGDFKAIENKRCGITISKMPAKVYGVFQKNYTRLTVNISENNIGQTCNGDDFFEALKKANEVIGRHSQYNY